MAERIGDLTVDELEKLVNPIVDECLKQMTLNGQPAVRRAPAFIEDLRRHLIEQAPDAPSPTEMLLEEREQRRNPSG